MDHEGQASLINPTTTTGIGIIATLYPHVLIGLSHACDALLASLVIDFEISSYEFSSHPRVNPPLLSQPCALRFKFLLEINTSAVFVNGIPKQAMYSKSAIDVRAFQRGVIANLTRSGWQFVLSEKKEKKKNVSLDTMCV